mgnify:CR=1 FL=1
MFRIKFCREILLKLLYQSDIMGTPELDSQMMLVEGKPFYKELTEAESEFIRTTIDTIRQNREKIDKIISENLIGWKIERLNPIDRSLLRMGISESYHNDQKAIIIDDIIRIAKKYGEEDSYKIINAVLDKVL